eukprot:scpid83085/ scgid11055/ 
MIVDRGLHGKFHRKHPFVLIEGQAKMKLSELVVFWVLWRMVLIREGCDAPFNHMRSVPASSDHNHSTQHQEGCEWRNIDFMLYAILPVVMHNVAHIWSKPRHVRVCKQPFLALKSCATNASTVHLPAITSIIQLHLRVLAGQ